MSYIFWTIVAIIGSVAIYWVMDWESHFRDDDQEK